MSQTLRATWHPELTRWVAMLTWALTTERHNLGDIVTVGEVDVSISRLMGSPQ